MNTLNEQQLQTHIPIVSWLLIAYSVLNMIGGLIASAFVMCGSVFFTQLGPAVNDAEATRIFSALTTLTNFVAVLIGALAIGLALPALVAGIGLLARKSWARVFGVIVSVLMLIVFPTGTLVGIYTIFVLMQDVATNYFASPPARLQTAPHLA